MIDGALGKHGGSSRRRKGENDKNMVYSGMKFSNNNFKGKKTNKEKGMDSNFEV